MTNQAGVDHAGVHAIDRLLRAGRRTSPRSSVRSTGFAGTAAPGEQRRLVGRFSATGLPIYSLYGATLAPTREMLANVDVILVDLPDVGCAVLHLARHRRLHVMRAAARSAKAGRRARSAQPDRRGGAGERARHRLSPRCVGRLAVPMRHGMTLGELARLAAHDLGIARRAARGSGDRMAAVRAVRRPGPPLRAAQPQSPGSGGARSTIPGPVSSRGPRCRSGGEPTRPSARSARPGSTPRGSWPGSAPTGFPGSGSARCSSRRGIPATGSIADTLLAGIRLTLVDREHATTRPSRP